MKCIKKDDIQDSELLSSGVFSSLLS